MYCFAISAVSCDQPPCTTGGSTRSQRTRNPTRKSVRLAYSSIWWYTAPTPKPRQLTYVEAGRLHLGDARQAGGQRLGLETTVSGIVQVGVLRRRDGGA